MPRGNVRVSVTADPSGMEKGLKRGERALEKFGKTGEHHLRNLAKGAAAAGTAYLGITEAKGAIDTTEELAKSTLKLNRNLGLSVKTASEFAAVAKARGIEQKQVAQTFGILSKQIVGLDAGTKSATETFKALGLTQKDLAGLNFEQTLGKVSDQINAMPAGAEKTATAMKLFGRGWQTLLPVLGGGSKEMKDQLALADKYGATFGGKTVGEMKKFIASQREAKLAGIGLQIAFGTKVAPVLTTVINRVTEFVAQMRDGTGAGGRFAKKMEDLWRQLQPVRDAIKSIGKFLGEHPKLLAAAAGAFVIWRTAAAAAAFTAKAKLIATFLGLGPKAAVGGAVAGRSFGTAASTATGVKMRAFGWGALGRLAGIGFAAGFVIAALPTINKLTGGGLSGNDIITKVKQAIFDLRGLINTPAGKGTQLPPLTRRPGGATGGVIAGRYSDGDVHDVRVAGEEVILNPKQQRMVDGGGRIMDVLRATGAKVIGSGVRAASGAYGKIVAAANSIDSRHYPYRWGGGHNSSFSGPYDCSGAWSAILHSAGLLSSPLVSGQFANWGDPGPGRVTLYANSGHVYGKIGNSWWGTSRSNPGGGAGWFPGAPRSGFTVRHVPEKLLGGGGSGDGLDRGVPKAPKRSTGIIGGGSDITGGGRFAGHVTGVIGGSGYVPGASGLSNTSVPDSTTDTTDTSAADAAAAEAQAVIEALNALIELQQAANALLAEKNTNTQKLLNLSQSQYQSLFAGFVAAISGDIGGRVGLGFMSPSTAGTSASY